MNRTLNVGIFIFDQVEVLDFAGPYEVFTTAARICKNAQLFHVQTIAQNAAIIKARAGLQILPDASFASHVPLDILIVAGGVVSAELDKTEVCEWIKTVAPTCMIVASVCTGAFLLAKADLLHDLTVATHWEDCVDLQSQFPTLKVQEQHRWIDHGHIVTSAGISAGIDMSLHLVERLCGLDWAVKTARQMDYHSAS